MGYFSVQTDTLPLPSNPKFTVTLKRRVRGGEYWDAINRVIDSGKEGSGQTAAVAHSLMQLVVVAWNLTDDKGELVPITEEALRDLEREDYDFVRAEVSRRSALRPEKDEVPFGKGSGSSSRATRSQRRP